MLTERGIELPLEDQATTTTEKRLEGGERVRLAIFGENMRGFADPRRGEALGRRSR